MKNKIIYIIVLFVILIAIITVSLLGVMGFFSKLSLKEGVLEKEIAFLVQDSKTKDISGDEMLETTPLSTDNSLKTGVKVLEQSSGIADYIAKPSPSLENRVPVHEDQDSISKIDIEVFIGGEKYPVEISSGENVHDAMKKLYSSGKIAFKSKYYGGLGYFIEEINGVRNENGTYWTLYINGKYSVSGASGYKLLEGDKVEWKYENL